MRRMDEVSTIELDPVKIRAAREAAGLSPAEVEGKGIGIKQAQLNHIECGRKRPSADVLARLCALYNVDLRDLTKAAA
jgi:transcriptional regulator with XRE-family HTH domain